jgi:hypothetical protein
LLQAAWERINASIENQYLVKGNINSDSGKKRRRLIDESIGPSFFLKIFLYPLPRQPFPPYFNHFHSDNSIANPKVWKFSHPSFLLIFSYQPK